MGLRSEGREGFVDLTRSCGCQSRIRYRVWRRREVGGIVVVVGVVGRGRGNSSLWLWEKVEMGGRLCRVGKIEFDAPRQPSESQDLLGEVKV